MTFTRKVALPPQPLGAADKQVSGHKPQKDSCAGFCALCPDRQNAEYLFSRYALFCRLRLVRNNQFFYAVREKYVRQCPFQVLMKERLLFSCVPYSANSMPAKPLYLASSEHEYTKKKRQGFSRKSLSENIGIVRKMQAP